MKARPKTKASWVTNALTGEEVSPDLDWLIDRLASLNPLAVKDRPDVIARHAHQVYGSWLALRWRGDTNAYKIKGEQRPRAVRIDAKRGLANDLRRLRRAARSKSDKRWRAAWLGVSGKTRSLFDPAPPSIVKRNQLDEAGRLVLIERADLDVSNLKQVRVRGLHALMPTAAAALPLIEGAIRKLGPAADRRKRQSDDYFDEFVGAVCLAHRELTGAVGITWNTNAGKFDGVLVELGRDIVARFGTALFSIDRMRKFLDPL